MNYPKLPLADGLMITVSGRVIDLFKVDETMIIIEDIAHGLSNNCRWNGHTKSFFSVAQHCCMMFDVAPEGMELSYLLHDGEEAYWGDIIRPLKNLLPKEITDKIREMRQMIFKKFGCKPIDDKLKDWDNGLLNWEYDNIIRNNSGFSWSPEKAKEYFLVRFYSVFK